MRYGATVVEVEKIGFGTREDKQQDIQTLVWNRIRNLGYLGLFLCTLETRITY